MEEWSDWVVEDSDPAEMVRQMRNVLADPNRSHDDKLEALSLLTNLADDMSVQVLQWYQEHADAGMEIPAMLALMEANRLNRPPEFESWHDELLDLIQDVGQELNPTGGAFPAREIMRAAVAEELRDSGFEVSEGGQALLKYDGQLINLTPIDLVVNHSTLVGFWDRADEERAWSAIDGEDESEMFDPLEEFYSTLRSANLPWGILVDISGDTLYTDLIQNMDVDRGMPRVEYLLSLPRS